MSYDNTGALGASTWRHVAFVEQPVPAERRRETVDLGMPGTSLPGADSDVTERTDFRWLMESDVCKHCTHAACLDVCPTGALFRTEFGTVVVQNDICNGCGYCIPACPYGVIDRRDGPAGDPAVGLAQKCTLCYDRLSGGMEPACAKACPTDSIQFGDLDGCASAPIAGSRNCRTRVSRPPSCTGATRATASAAPGRSSCYWTSRRCTGCPRTRCHHAGPARDVAAGRGRGCHAARRRGRRVRRPSKGTPMTDVPRHVAADGAGAASRRWCPTPSSRATTAAPS